MKIVSTNKNLLTNIAKFSHFDDIMSFKQSKKTIGFKLNVKSNEKMNDILLYHRMIFKFFNDVGLLVPPSAIQA
jgi:hypothetical protein